MLTRVLAWADRRAGVLVAGVVAAAAALRVVLALHCPWEYGFMWDPYYETIWRVYQDGSVPASTACWECYQPPLFMVLGAPFYALGRAWIAPAPWPHDSALLAAEAVPLAAGFVALLYVYRLLRLLRFRRSLAWLGFALAASLPVVFLSSYALEPDLLLGAIVTAFLFYLTRWIRRAGRAGAASVAALGVLAGLAAATKFSGLVAPVAGGVLLAAELARPARRARAAWHLALFVAAATAVGGWRYVTNWTRYGTPFYATASAADGFRMANRPSYRHQYEFATLRLGALFALTRPDAPDGMLTVMPGYNSVWTTLHGLMWNDLGFFTNPTRHGTGVALYARRTPPPALSDAVIVLGLLPSALAVAGVLATARRRAYRPLALVLVAGLASYLPWVVAQQFWALKAKYLLFLLAPWSVYAMAGVRWATRVLPRPALAAVLALLAVLVVLAHAWQLAFALG